MKEAERQTEDWDLPSPWCPWKTKLGLSSLPASAFRPMCLLLKCDFFFNKKLYLLSENYSCSDRLSVPGKGFIGSPGSPDPGLLEPAW